MVATIGKWRLTAGAVVLLLTIAAGSFLLARRQLEPFQVRRVSDKLPADGRERAILRVVRNDGGPVKIEGLTARTTGASSDNNVSDVHLVKVGNEVDVWMRAPVMAGERRLQVQSGRRSLAATISFAASEIDSIGDGMPDALRLHSAEDRDAFRQWFWRLAELQAELPDTEKAREIQDCAALLRYSYREALKLHDAEWAEAQHAGDVTFESVRQWRYPETLLGAGLFRVRPGPLVKGDERNGAFAQFADAHALMSWNTYRVGRSIKAAKPGDLIFYKQLEQDSTYHSMVITGRNADWVVYHTGPIGKSKGEMRRMMLADLLQHPDARWRPVAENSNFLGVFRWNVLHEGY